MSEHNLERSEASHRPARVIGILGMHRSGTSCLTGTLQSAGLFLGEHHTWNRYNQRGNRENQSIVDLHDAVLAHNEGAWDRPPATSLWPQESLDALRSLLAQHSSESVFGFKDPRALLLLDGWKRVCPDIEFVGIFRHPNAVAASLAQRNAKARKESLQLWYAYNSRLINEFRRSPFPVFNFDDDEALLDSKIMRVAGELGLAGRGVDEPFYSPELKHNRGRGAILLPGKLRSLYRDLRAICL